MAAPDIPQLIEQLSNKSSPKRRAAAKKLRRLKAKEAGSALLAALENELKNKRTWETQYQMIMALGESGYTESLGFLTQLAKQESEATMVYMAIGDAVTRLTYQKEGNINFVIDLLNSKPEQPLFIDGLIRAIAIAKLAPPQDNIDKLILYGNKSDIGDNHKAWIATAAAGWSGDKVINFLNNCLNSKNEQLKKAAQAALAKKYINWSIL